MSPNGKKPEAGGEGVEGGEEKLDWKKRVEELESPEERLDFLAELYGEIDSFLGLSEEEKKTVLAARREEEKRLKEQLDLAVMSPEARAAKIQERKMEIRQIDEEMKKLAREAAVYHLVAVRAEAERQRRAAEAEELKDLIIENPDELINLFIGVLKEKNLTRCAAILRKLAADGNENEILNYFGYPANIEGMHRFTAEFLIGRKLIKTPDGRYELGEKISRVPGTDYKPLNMEPQVAFAIESDISYIAESRNHWGVARIVGQKFGQFFQASDEEQVEAVMIEISKFNIQRVCREFNRLAYGGEDAEGKFHLSRSGLAILFKMSGLMKKFIENGEFNANTASKLWEIREVLRNAGIQQSFLDVLKKYVETRIEPDYGRIIKKAMAAPLPPLRLAT